MGLCSEAQTFKALLHLHCAIFSATCLAMPLRDKLPENCTVYMGCLAIFLLRKALHDVELSLTFRNGLHQLATPLQCFTPSSNFSRNFTAVLTRAHAHTSRVLF